MMWAQLQPWSFRVAAYPGESFGHFLGRYRRANQLSSKALARVLSLSARAVSDWEVPSRLRPPNQKQLASLASLVGLTVEELAAMLPPPREMMHLATRLCGECYAQAPAHKACWQLANSDNCLQHQLKLLSACPLCGMSFRLPALWESGCCSKCSFPFASMGVYQQSASRMVNGSGVASATK